MVRFISLTLFVASCFSLYFLYDAVHAIPDDSDADTAFKALIAYVLLINALDRITARNQAGVNS